MADCWDAADAMIREEIEKVEYASMLYDFYGSLLSESRREVTALYHDDDLSLSEIADELGQTRQAVHYTLKRAEKELEAYEEKLGLIKAYNRNRKLAAAAYEILDGADMDASYKDKLKRIIKEISE